MIKLYTKLSKLEMRRLAKQNKLRSDFEVWLDFHNHKMELLRTLFSFVSFIFSTLVLLKLLKII